MRSLRRLTKIFPAAFGGWRAVRHGMIATGIVVMAGQAVPAQAVTVNYNGGLVTGIDDLNVGGNLIDIIFVGNGASYDTAFGGVDIVYANAIAIRDAVMAALNLEPLVPNNFPNIAGTSGSQSNFVVPLRFSRSDVVTVGGGHSSSSFALQAVYSPNPGTVNLPQNVSLPAYAWVVVVPPEPVSTTPLPGALPLFATGLGALGLIAHRRKRKRAV